MKKKLLVVSLCAIIAIMAIAGSSLAWLQDSTVTITNTFTEGKVDIDLTETTGEKYQLIPGNTLPKDPTVTVVKGSEACYLYVKVVETNGVGEYIDYAIADGWLPLTGVSGVYYREVSKNDADDQTFAVLKDNQVVVESDVNMTDMSTIATAKPELKFTAYAIQKANTGDAAAAWATAKFN